MINNISALKFYSARYQCDVSVFENSMVKRMLQGIQYSCVATPTLKGLFSLHQIREISQSCESFESTLTYHCAYLLAFYGLFRISNLAPKYPSVFDPSHHLLRNDVAFLYPGARIKINRAKNIYIYTGSRNSLCGQSIKNRRSVYVSC